MPSIKGPVSRTGANPVFCQNKSHHVVITDLRSKDYGLRHMDYDSFAAVLKRHWLVAATASGSADRSVIFGSVPGGRHTLPQHNGPGIHLLYARDETEQICFDWTRKWTNLIVWITDLNGVFNEISNGTPVSLLLQQLRFTRCHMVTYSGKSSCKVIRCQRANQLQGNTFYVPYSSWFMTRIQKY